MDKLAIDSDYENQVERDRSKFGLTKRYKEIEVDRQEIERDINTKDRLR